jgi:DNA-binding NarL/FixJ family response regulator
VILTDVKILYIDNNEAVAMLFRQTANQHQHVECSTISESKRAVVNFIESTIAPEIIVISCGLKDIPCKTLIVFIRKQDQLRHSKIVVVGDYFTISEQRQYVRDGADQCMQLKPDARSISDFIVNNVIKMRTSSR